MGKCNLNQARIKKKKIKLAVFFMYNPSIDANTSMRYPALDAHIA
jgi:hypothetical protein